ncbi:transmembrane protein 150A isoform X3 [Narcine bancroftii]|uniref:transmembrane protein 150A isoform X3 n=1 Tax=Narcine bancroftii TaxID=1343680 RepID=UPI0038319F04
MCCYMLLAHVQGRYGGRRLGLSAFIRDLTGEELQRQKAGQPAQSSEVIACNTVTSSCNVLLIILSDFNKQGIFSQVKKVDNAKILHYVGAGVGFPSSMLFICFQSALTYKIAKNPLDYRIGHCRFLLTIVAFINLVLTGVFFIQERSDLQHAAAICEWVFTIIILIFYGTFAVEFGSITEKTLLEMLTKEAKKAHCKSDNSRVSSAHVNCTQDAMAMI